MLSKREGVCAMRGTVCKVRETVCNSREKTCVCLEIVCVRRATFCFVRGQIGEYRALIWFIPGAVCLRRGVICMETEIESTTPGAQVSPKAPRAKSIVNVRLIAALDQAERYATIAQRPEVATALTAKDLATDFVVDLLSDISACRKLLATFVKATTDRQVHTETEAAQRMNLVVLLQGVQNGAKRKWGRKPGQRDKLKGYFVGTTLKPLSFAQLSEAADTILEQAKLEALPGVTGGDLTALEEAIAAWKATNEAQAQAQNMATTAHTAADTLAGSIVDRRIEIQLAADTAFPYSDKANAAIRKEFGLPKNGPYSAV